MNMPTDPLYERTGVKVRYSPGCPYNEPERITNADRIRAMSDEELADWIIGVIQHGGVIPYGGTGVTRDWLKQESEE